MIHPLTISRLLVVGFGTDSQQQGFALCRLLSMVRWYPGVNSILRRMSSWPISDREQGAEKVIAVWFCPLIVSRENGGSEPEKVISTLSCNLRMSFPNTTSVYQSEKARFSTFVREVSKHPWVRLAKLMVSMVILSHNGATYHLCFPSTFFDM